MLAAAVVGPALGAEDKASQPAKAKPSRRNPTPQPEYDRVAAKQAYEEALRAFNLGHWQDAVAGFEKSYTLSGDAALLFNVAQAQRQARPGMVPVFSRKVDERRPESSGIGRMMSEPGDGAGGWCQCFLGRSTNAAQNPLESGG
jgi:hypothetical protein